MTRTHPPTRLFTLLALLLPAVAHPLVGAQESTQDSAQEDAQEAPASDPARRFADSLRLIEQGNYEAAIGELESLRALPEAPPAVAGILGALYAELGQMDKAYELLRPIAESEAANPAVLYNAGRAAVALGEIEPALSFFYRSTEMEPASPAARELGLLLGGLGSFEEGYRFLLPWVRQHPDDTRALMAATVGAVRLKRVAEAEELLSELDAEDPGVKLLWGQLLVAKGDPWGAIGYLKPTLDTAPDAIQRDIRYTLAGAYMTVGESEGAVETLEGREEGDPQVAIRLSQAIYQTGEVERSLATLEPFATPLLDPTARAQFEPTMVATVAIDYGSLLNNSGRAEEALPFLRIGTELAPDSRRGWQALGQALAATGSRDEAQAALERFKQLSEQEEQQQPALTEGDLADPTGRALREAMQLASQGQHEEALSRLMREAELAPNDPRPRLLVAQTLLQMERPGEALETALGVSAMAPDNADALYMVGASRMAMQDLVGAEETLRGVLQLAPEHTAAMSDLAVLLMAQGRPEEARVLLQRVLELRPDDPVARENLDRLEKG